MSLVVATPTLEQEDATGTQFVAEKPITVSCDSVALPDGSELTIQQATEFGYLIFRELSGGSIEVWDKAQTTWVPETPLPDLEALAYLDDIWQSLFVAIGQTDQSGQDKFATDRTSGYPKYFTRCYFKGKDDDGVEHEGTSPKSQAIEIGAAGENHRAGLAMDKEDPAQASEIRLYVKDASLTAEKGIVVIREKSGGFEIDINNEIASVKLTTQGDIELAPASGRKVIVKGDIDIQGTLSVNGITLNVP